MFDKLLELDSVLFQYLNGLGSPTYDNFWLIITEKIYWIPLFLFLIYIIYKEFGWRKTVFIFLFIAFLGLVTDQTSNLFKNGFERLRPNNDPTLKWTIRFLKTPQSYSFISGHASNSIAITTFIVLLLRQKIKNIYWLYLWPLLFAYSRIYLGLHFPSDILCGFLWGLLTGTLHYKGYRWVQNQVFKE